MPTRFDHVTRMNGLLMLELEVESMLVMEDVWMSEPASEPDLLSHTSSSLPVLENDFGQETRHEWGLEHEELQETSTETINVDDDDEVVIDVNPFSCSTLDVDMDNATSLTSTAASLSDDLEESKYEKKEKSSISSDPSHTLSEKQYLPPNVPMTFQIYLVLINSPCRMATAPMIYAALEFFFPFYKSKAGNYRNVVRNKLSVSPFFVKTTLKEGSRFFWGLNNDPQVISTRNIYFSSRIMIHNLHKAFFQPLIVDQVIRGDFVIEHF